MRNLALLFTGFLATLLAGCESSDTTVAATCGYDDGAGNITFLYARDFGDDAAAANAACVDRAPTATPMRTPTPTPMRTPTAGATLRSTAPTTTVTACATERRTRSWRSAATFTATSRSSRVVRTTCSCSATASPGGRLVRRSSRVREGGHRRGNLVEELPRRLWRRVPRELRDGGRVHRRRLHLLGLPGRGSTVRRLRLAERERRAAQHLRHLRRSRGLGPR